MYVRSAFLQKLSFLLRTHLTPIGIGNKWAKQTERREIGVPTLNSKLLQCYISSASSHTRLRQIGGNCTLLIQTVGYKTLTLSFGKALKALVTIAVGGKEGGGGVEEEETQESAKKDVEKEQNKQPGTLPIDKWCSVKCRTCWKPQMERAWAVCQRNCHRKLGWSRHNHNQFAKLTSLT